MIKPWKILKEQDVSPSEFYPVHKMRVKLPDGRTYEEFFVSRFHDGAIIVPLTEDGKIVFVKQFKLGVEQVIVELPAGFINKGELPIKGAKRELLEETGYEAKKLVRLGTIVSMPSKSGHKTHCFLATGLKQKKQHFDETEEIEVVKIPIKDILPKINKGDIWAAETISALVLAKKHIKNLL